ncbi:class I SAM-dependent methyltransferase [Clostridium fungisolvens]|uniref:2-methoxy-6-polyprenyl-1,4-benzoquinol methylase, mitochondrial n=1 Tax=Clostridium fungisolvens TaxID=1604897 RepID=A0A6V8SM78_9CLOT|nr:class I SAM-dependent methyltransferase [Clostridium fungisolvens]GFP76278.1 2-methoxy-6-polyprenyl-1,4-benzoquinol methylase, mitochondrial [Clostridium fungisolvens]
MSIMDKVENVKEQYKDGNNLAKRTNLHVKHSTNKQGFVPWLFEKYEFSKGYRILELGCGNGTQWENRIHILPEDCTLVLSDFSEGMVKVVWDKYSGQKNMLAQKLDIQNIPFPDNCFDIIIANHMLYHVPNLPKALSEVKRVLKNGGKFYAATNGDGGMRTYLRDAFKKVNQNLNSFTKELSFTLQNGQDLLEKYFDDVQRHDYEDSLSITETQDLIDWLESTVTIATYSKNDLNGFYDYFEAIRQKEGAINIHKEAGLFISTKL